MQKAEDAIKKIQSLLQSGKSLCCSFSGGKDSTCVLILFFEAIRRLVEAGESVPPCYITNSNTRREMPSMNNYLMGVINNITMHIARHKLPVEFIEVEPSLSGRFAWTCLGRGKLPRYEGMSRDCARDEKIAPQQRQLKMIERECGGVVISLLGSRIEESGARSASMAKYSMDEMTIVEVDGQKTFAVIADWWLEDVWELIHGTTQNERGEAKIFPTFCSNFDELIKLYRDANEGTCGVIIGDAGNKAACGSRFGCAWCTVTGDRDKSLESLISEDEGLYGYMSGLIKFRKFMRNIRWDMNRRDWRGRKISKAGYMKVTPDYWSPQTKRELLRYLLTLDALEVERARAFEDKWYAGEVEHTPENYLLTGVMFQFVTYDDILSIDFAWSMGRDWPEASVAAREWIEIHDMGYRYHIPDVPEAPRVTIPKPRWYDVNPVVEDVVGLKGLVPTNYGAAFEELRLHEAKELLIEPGMGFSYINEVKSRYYEISGVDVSEVCRAAVHHGWFKMPRKQLERYHQLALRNDYLLRQMRQVKPMKVDEWNGEDKLMSVHEYLVEESISDDEHNQLLSEYERAELENDEQIDIFGIDSKLEAIEERKSSKKPKVPATVDVQVENVASYYDAGRQQALLM